MRRFLSVMSTSQANPRRFAPLKETAGQTSDLPRLQGVVFDVDGTLCQPQNHMFAAMRSVLGIDKSIDILEHIYALPTPEQQETAMESIRAIERKSMAEQIAQPGLTTLMAYLSSRNIRKGICTRNFEQPVTHLLTKFLGDHTFHPVVTREFRPPKPDPAGILFIARSWGLARGGDKGEGEGEGGGVVGEVGDGSGLIMVGDSVDDMTAGRRAGAATVLLVNDVNRHLADHEHTDLVIDRLDELVDTLEGGFVGREVSASG